MSNVDQYEHIAQKPIFKLLMPANEELTAIARILCGMGAEFKCWNKA